MPLQSTSGAASYDAFGGGVAAVPKYIEDYFSTFLYQGTGAAQTITNGIDLSTKGGLVWIKGRSQAWDHGLFDTARGAGYRIISNSTAAENFSLNYVSSFNNNGFSLGSPSSSTNTSGDNYVSWSWAKAPKFFDVVTYTGNGSARTIAHNLGSVPACIIVKCTSVGYNWMVYHSSLGNTQYLNLNNTNPVDTDANLWNSTTPTSSVFSVGASLPTNQNGQTYVAYLFAHNAGGFGLTGTDNVISCGSYTGNGSTSGPSITLGYEPQWILIKDATDAGPNWAMFDNMRGIATGGTEQRLYANTSGAEATTGGNDIDLTATGFDIKTDLGYLNTSGSTYIYIAIRRGPMKVPTSGTSVFAPVTRTGTGANATISGVGFAPDVLLSADRNSAPQKAAFYDKLRGVGTQGGGAALLTSSTTTEQNYTDALLSYTNTGVNVGAESSTVTINYSGEPFVTWFFQRAPSFFDEVCFTTTDGTYSGNHNLGVVPELLIFKSRDGTGNWQVVSSYLTSASYFLRLNSTIAEYNNTNTNYTATSTTLTIPNAGFISFSATMVAYLFATCAGVSKVGSYTGNGSSQTINCGFTGGARFVMVKATSTTGNWIVADSARGIVAGNDPALYLNSTAAEVTGLDWIDADNSGFVVNETATIAANTNGVSYIFFAVA